MIDRVSALPRVCALFIGLTGCDKVFSLDRDPSCGDGVLAQDESCDDGGTDSGDGCGGTCEIEPGFECPTTNAGLPCLPIVGLSRGAVTTELDAAGELGSANLAFDCPAGEVMIGVEGYANLNGDNLGRINVVCGSLALGPSGDALLSRASESGLFGTMQTEPLLAAICARDEVATGFVPTTNTYVSGIEWRCQKLSHTGGALRFGDTRSIGFGPTVGDGQAARLCPPGEVIGGALGGVGTSLTWLGFACAPISAVACGDSVVTPPETCDDGNLLRHDGCDGRCQVE